MYIIITYYSLNIHVVVVVVVVYVVVVDSRLLAFYAIPVFQSYTHLCKSLL